MLTVPDAIDVCAFRVAGHCFAVGSHVIAEVLPSAEVSPVPLAPGEIIGILHLRGRIVPVIDMRRRLGLTATARAAASAHLVIRHGDEWYSLLVDEVLDVHAIPVDRIEHPVKPVGGPATEAVLGVFADTGRLLHVLDPERIVQALHRQRMSPPVRHGVSHDR